MTDRKTFSSCGCWTQPTARLSEQPLSEVHSAHSAAAAAADSLHPCSSSPHFALTTTQLRMWCALLFIKQRPNLTNILLSIITLSELIIQSTYYSDLKCARKLICEHCLR